VTVVCAAVAGPEAYALPEMMMQQVPPDSTEGDTSRRNMPFPIRDRRPYERNPPRHPFDLNEPKNINSRYELDPESNSYNYSSKVGNQDYRLPASISVSDQMREENNRQNKEYFRQRSQAQNFTTGSGIIPPLRVGPKIFDKIFGSGVIDIKPRGSAEIIFSGNFNTVRNPAFAPDQQTTGQFDFKQKIQLNVQGSIGERMKLNINYDTEAAFDFENQVKLDYSGKEDDIIKKIELGNVSLPLTSTLIQGSQSLFGVKTTLQFGRLTMTTVVSQQRGKTTETEVTGGSQTTKFDIQADAYDMNRHFFLAQYFRDNYDAALSSLPIVNSAIVINQVEVWVTNRTGAFDNSRDVIGFSDLGESDKRDNKRLTVNSNPAGPVPDNNSNVLFDYLTNQGNTDAKRATYEVQAELIRDSSRYGLKPISQYQMINYARQLNPSEYTINKNLGYISLNQSLNNDDVLCVAYNYTNTIDGKVYQVGEFAGPAQGIASDPTRPNVLFVKMLKGPSMRPDLPIWDLMMKNVYSLGTFGVQQKDFRLSIMYADDPSGADLTWLPVQNEPLLTGQNLLRVLNVDRLNTQQELAPDGLFDFIEGITINSQQGRIIFPVVEPFGTYIASKFVNDRSRARYYSYYELYDSTKFAALQLPQYNKYFIRGSYQGSSSSEISLNATNIPRGSVKVTANGAPLTENTDYTVDYNLGRVRIVNTGLLNSGAVIKVSSESNSLFSVQQKTLLGSRFDYKYSNNLIFGGTFMYLSERPLTPKVNIGEEPLSNMMIGLDGTYKKDSRFLTKLVDRIPFIETKETSNITVSGEYAQLIPGVNSALAQSGTAYLDDFEGAETPFDLRLGGNWVMASTPQGQPDLFPEAALTGSLNPGFRRANLAWYVLAPSFVNENNSDAPPGLQDADYSTHCVRYLQQTEIYPSKQIQTNQPSNLQSLDLAFYPKERGPYNYTVDGLNPDGTLRDPRRNWGGIMRKIDQNDFEANNIDYIEMWVMDPWACNPNPNASGELYINLGNISEDILADGRRAAENGLPKVNATTTAYVDTTSWAIVPRAPVINFAFDADSRDKQDVGLDGFDDAGERAWFDTSYLQKLEAAYGTSSAAYQQALSDPSNDNYHYYLGYQDGSTPILERYKRYNRHQGNSNTANVTEGNGGGSMPGTGTNIPDNEDINRDYTLNDIEEYYQYKIDISKQRFVVGQNFVTDSVVSPVTFRNGTPSTITWYQLKVPIREYEKRVGQILDFKSIRFIRVFMRGFEADMLLRVGAMQLVRADWRKYLNNLEEGKENKPADPEDDTRFVVSTVNVEKNSSRTPVVYKIPPGIQREVDFSNPQAIQQNEQSLSLLACNLKDGDARGVFKATKGDLRQYAKLRMFVHAEGENLRDGELVAFIRFGTDLTNNYYEYEMPLKVTQFGETNDRGIWPDANEMVITLEEFINAKIARTNENFPFTAVYRHIVGGRRYSVIGLPDLSNVKVMMLGIRNPKRIPGAGETDDGLPKCGEVWFNEMRMTEFSNRGGWAAIGRVQAKLADFGNMQVTGSVATVGFGGLDKKLQERSFNDQYIYDIQSSFELGKFLPKQSGISVPMFLSYGNTLVRPLYNPLNPDTKLQKELDELHDADRTERIRRAADDFTSRKSINFTNVRKNKMNGAQNHVYDIENFNATWSFNETFRRNQTMESYILQTYKAQVGYTYSFNPKPWEPFSTLIKSKQLTLIKDFNLYFKPQSWGANVSTERRYGETIYRNNDASSGFVEPMYDKIYTMTRYYEMNYNLSKGLKFDYNATAQARIDEPQGKIDETTKAKKDTIWDNFWKGGRLTQFDQMTRMTYSIPISKIQQLSWVNTSTYTYTANYQWKQAPPAADSLGNTISNSRVQAWNFNFNLMQLYNKFPFLRDINSPGQRPSARDPKKTEKGAKKGPTVERESSKKPPALVFTMKLLMSLKNVSVSYTTNDATTLPGFDPKPQYLGQDFSNGGPGWDFILAMQGRDYRTVAARNGWITRDTRVTSYYLESYRESLNGKATLEPVTDLRVELNISKEMSRNTSSLFGFDSTTDAFRDRSRPSETGTYSITYNIWASTFSSEQSNGMSDVFQQFHDNRKVISSRLGQDAARPSLGDSAGFSRGYGHNSQDVLIPALLAAYSGTDAKDIALTPFPQIPMPNWSITYTGFSKMAFVKEYASNVTLKNAYTSMYTVGGFQTILNDSETNVFSGDYTPQYQIRSVSINERWGPFLGIDITFTNNVTAKVEYLRNRMLNFSLNNQQMSEQIGNEFAFGIGWITDKLVLPIKGAGGRRLVLDNKITMRLDFSIREAVTKVRYLDRESNDPVLGQIVYSVKPNIDYMLSEKLMLRIFYDYRKTNPATSNSFPTIIQSGGFSLRYTIQ
jgi:cell surface protein SprA